MYKKGYLKFLRFNPDEETSWNEPGPTFSRLPLNPQIYAHLFQLPQLSMLHWRLSTSFLAQQPTTKLNGTSR